MKSHGVMKEGFPVEAGKTFHLPHPLSNGPGTTQLEISLNAHWVDIVDRCTRLNSGSLFQKLFPFDDHKNSLASSDCRNRFHGTEIVLVVTVSS